MNRSRKQHKRKTLELTFIQEKTKRTFGIDMLGEMVTSSIWFLGIFMGLVSMFEVKGMIGVVILVDILLLICLYGMEKYAVYLYGIIGVCVMIFLVGTVIQETHIIQGIYLLNNQVADILGRKIGVYIPKYVVQLSEEQSIIYLTILMSFIGGLIAFCVFIANKYRNMILLYFIGFFLLFVQTMSSLLPDFLYSILLIVAIIVSLASNFIRGRYANDMIRNGQRAVISRILIILSIVMFGLLGVLKLVVSSESYQPLQVVANLNQKLQNTIEDLRYEKEKTNSYTQGDFTGLGNLKLTDKEALEVIMEYPQSMYLKGFVGEIYEGTKWAALDTQETYDDYEDLCWMQENGFNRWNQLALVSDVTEEPKDNKKKVSLTIHNVNANSKYFYVPYEVSKMDETIEENNTMNAALRTKGFYGKRISKMSFDCGLVEHYPSMAKEYYRIIEETKNTSYKTAEMINNAFVYKHDTVIPQRIQNLLEAHLGSVSEESESHMGYEEAYQRIMKYFNENITYDENPGSLPKDNDFVQYFMENSGKGFAAQYATTATLMYRYYGIPARYVEGYLITPKDVQDVDELEPITITGKNAHAWVEIYIDGIGWVPIEVTPAYLDVMNTPDFFGAQSEVINEENAQKQGNAVDQEITSEQLKKKEIKNGKKWNLKIILLILLLIVGIVAVIVCLSFIILKSIKWHRRKKRFISGERKDCICEMFKFILQVLKYDNVIFLSSGVRQSCKVLEEKYSKEYAEEFSKIINYMQEAKYSTHILSDERQKETYSCMQHTIEHVKKKKNWFQRVYMKFSFLWNT